MCGLIKCSLCIEQLTNPKCNPELAMILVALAVYLFSNIIYFVGKIIIALISVIIWILKRKWSLIRFLIKCCKKTKTENKEKIVEKIKILKYNRKNRLPMKVTIAIIIFVISLQRAVCLTTITADEEKCILDTTGVRKCLFEKTLEISFNPTDQEIDIKLQDYQDNFVGSMKFILHRLKASCVKTIKYFSRSYDIQVISGWRCAHTGSCINQKCSSIKMNDTIIELNMENQKFPGITRCMETEGGWANGCFYVDPACLFYRFSAVPTNDLKILEIFRCPKWDLELDVNIIIETQNDKQEKLISLKPGFTTEWNDLRITATSMTVAPLPILNQLFVSDENRVAILEPESEDKLRSFKCSSKASAIKFNECKLDPLSCDCNSADHNVACLCYELLETRQLFKRDLTLPFEHNGILLDVDHGTIKVLPDFSAAQIQTQIKGLTLKTEILANKCKVTNVKLIGCYKCNRGAKLELTCKTDFGNSLGNIVCPSLTTFTTCVPKGETRNLSVHLTHSQIEETCEIFCGSSYSKFELKGILNHPEEIMETKWAQKHSTKMQSLMDIDLNHLLKFLFFPRYLLILLLALFCFVLIGYCFLPCLTRFLLFKLFNIFSARSVAPKRNFYKDI
uniref:Phlebovirus glycoprotein G2 fusion domain-containing protein n=1 Tax=Meloidogyne enterolobii TaxID=390850 RepID=A0A6V7W6Q6_MELEN|nr:unnamed protein product [Meloidogyne enterolobii]